MELVVLGSGCFTWRSPPPGVRRTVVRNPAGYAVRLGRGRQILLFDLGFGNLRQLSRAGLDPAEVTHVFLSHRHPDHVGDLAALLFYFRYDRRPAAGRLRLYGPRGIRSFVERLARAHHPWVRPRGYSLSVEELEERSVTRGEGWRVLAREVPHTTEALAFRLESAEGSLCYSGDTGYDPGLARFAAGVDVFLVECTLPESSRSPGHLKASQAVELGRLSGARRVLLTHLSPASERALAGLKSGGRVRKAADLLRVRF